MNKIMMLVSAFFVAGCGSVVADATSVPMPATEARVATSTATEHPTETATVSVATERPSPTAWPTQTRLPPLSEVGPWLVYYRNDIPYVTNVNGSGFLAFEGLPADISTHRRADGSSHYGLISFVSRDGDSGTIYIYQLPSGQLYREIDLFICPDETPDCEFNVGHISRYVLWSPNGRYLAFVAARGSLSTDLYIYDAETDKITQLTDGDNQVGQVYWSPDSQWIFHEEEEPGSQWIEALWAAKVDGSVVNWVEGQGMLRMGIRLITWVNDTQAVITTISMGGYHDVHIVDMQDGIVAVLFEGYIVDWDLIVYDSEEQIIGFFPSVAYGTEDYEEVIYLVSPYQTKPYNTGLESRDFFWDSISGDFIALGYECITFDGTTGDAYAINIDGKKECVVAPEQPRRESFDYIVVGFGEYPEFVPQPSVTPTASSW